MFKEVEKYLVKGYDFTKDVVKNRILFKKKKETEFKILREIDLNSIYRELQHKGKSISFANLKKLLESDFVPEVNAIKDYFSKLPAWDNKTDYISQLAKTVSTHDDALFEKALRKWIVATLACAINDKDINHTALILVGPQGCGKTTWLLKLIPMDLHDYVTSSQIKPGDKDSMLRLCDNILINMDEMASYSNTQIEFYKELITKDKVSERRAYAQFSENYIRRASFVGSTNNSKILVDTTGNRRFLVFEVKNIDYLHQVDLDMVYAQAKALLDSGFQHWFDNTEIQLLEKNNANFRQLSTEEEYLDMYFRKPSVSETNSVEYMNASEIIAYIKKESSVPVLLNNVALGKVLRAKGFSEKKISGAKKYSVIRLK
ncbi:DUF5906 domain-containing protein [Aestuariibaculum sp. M13]|uniref:VapE domain-containing protein n=1 Tax=Aestuariibaculum sp. M13 TaxID=2967132 RepID=UPI002159CC91|nr:VapE domain-containing protein [Aestuariibaculum sp. M13]MCR8667082.1 DUF5906 domain-containing protein [Aestuariibaculum sp. M13]